VRQQDPSNIKGLPGSQERSAGGLTTGQVGGTLSLSAIPFCISVHFPICAGGRHVPGGQADQQGVGRSGTVQRIWQAAVIPTELQAKVAQMRELFCLLSAKEEDR
jgi:hypothetical protein